MERYTPALERTVRLRDYTYDSQVWGDTFNGLYHVPPDVIRPKRVLDLGANIGLTAAHYRQMWPYCEVFAVELDRATANVGRQNTDDQVRWMAPLAVAGHSGEAFYDRQAVSDAYSISNPTHRRNSKVPAMTLTEVISQSDFAYIDFCKMDIEGSEWDVFEQAEQWAPNVHSLLVEVHGQQGESSEVLLERAINALSGAGYNAVHHERHPQAVWAIL